MLLNVVHCFDFAVLKKCNHTPWLFVKLLKAWHYIVVNFLHQPGKPSSLEFAEFYTSL